MRSLHDVGEPKPEGQNPLQARGQSPAFVFACFPLSALAPNALNPEGV